MKRAGFVLLLAVLLFLSGCGNLMRGSEGLVAKAREEIPLADMENTELCIAGARGWKTAKTENHPPAGI